MSLLAILVACQESPSVPPDPVDDVAGVPSVPGGDTVDAPSTPRLDGFRWDVLVIGGGPAGLAAAADALAAGATVRVLEREESLGGSANWAGGLMLFSGSAQQAQEGIEDSPELLLAEWPGFTGGDPDDAWVRYFAENNVPLVYDWLHGLGLRWSDPRADPSAGTTSRVHGVSTGGSGLVAVLADQVPASVVRYRAQAEELVRDEDGRVGGVVWTDLDTGVARTWYADTVVVATGGFMHDLERVRAERPDLADKELSWGSWPGADGNGLTLLEAEGAAVENLAAVGLYAHGAPGLEDPNELGVSFISDVPWVNVEGLRFVDESTTNDFRTGSLRAVQPGGDAWMVFDDAMGAGASFMVNTPTGATYPMMDLVEAGLVTVADDLPALASTLGIDGDALEDEIEGWNAAVLGAEDDAWRASMERAAPVQVAPYYALPVAITVAKGFGGIDVDLQGRVLDTAGEPIPGLYAAGELTGMLGGSLVGDYGFTGSLSAVVLGGRVAGQNASAEALAR